MDQKVDDPGSFKASVEIVGGGSNAFSHFERGTAKPLAAVNNLIRLPEKHPDLLDKSKGES